ncbi:unnamed protein product [Rotaria sordida]|uniref:EGF-like domain-containing protein n=1 Tax=Rotaria sordida TaxID=392033 RepID=A0A818RZ18_9BILA|nr:unnamed protein product [Rotaria sordida]CAF3661935.1 unnamed protein product [Rotaria sordida]CAF3712131.1 unnamed protein product [Rotaria sordida]
MVQWLIIILVYDFAMLKLSLSEVTLSLRLLHYKNRNGLTYENRPCDTRLEHDINRDGRCDTGFLFCLVHLPFQNPHNCTLGDHFTGFVGGDDIHFINIDQQLQRRSILSINKKRQRSSLISLWFQPTIYFHFNYPKTGIGLIVEVFDIDDNNNQTIHDSIDFYGRTLTDLKLYRSVELAQPQRIYLRSLFGTYTNLTVDFLLYCSPNYYGNDCEIFCSPNEQGYECDLNTGQKICKHGYFGQDCLSDVRACEDQPCVNNGTCVVYLRSYLCQCQKGFTGRSCEIAIKTIDHICNRATCIHGDCTRDGHCICHIGWTSKNCNRRFMKESGCASRPCLHNSTCENLIGTNQLSTYRCHCRIGYIGRNCEVAIVTSCERKPCIHGQCLKIDLYTEICICEENWTGIDCSQALFIPATITQLADSTRTFDTVTRIPSVPITAIKPMKNLTLTPLTDDLRDYLDWLNEYYAINRLTNSYQSITTSATFHKNNYSPCSSAPCHHNSTCVIQSEHSFQCLCSPSFIGVYCEIEILNIAHFRNYDKILLETNPCQNSPCQHQSICVTKSNHDVQCICRPHYTGKYCQNPPPFKPPSSNRQCTRICRNGGICLIDESNKELCICKSSYTGFYCELSKNSSCNIDPCISNPCLSNGTCRSIISSINYTCSCLEQYTGDRCEFYIESDSTYVLSRDIALNYDENNAKNSTDLWPLAIVFGYVFSLMLVFIIIWFLWYGLTIRPQSYFRSDIPYGERTTDRYQPYRLGVSNPLFFINQEYNSNPISKPFSN